MNSTFCRPPRMLLEVMGMRSRPFSEENRNDVAVVKIEGIFPVPFSIFNVPAV